MFLHLFASFLLLLGVLFASLESAQAQSSSQSAEQAKRALLSELNRERESAGLGPLKVNPILSQIASYYSEFVFDKDKSHLSDKVDEWFHTLRYPQQAWAVRSMGSNLDPTRQARSFLSKDSSKKVFLNPRFNEIGLVYKGGLLKSDRGDGNLWIAFLAEPVKPAKAGWRDRTILYVNQFRERYGLPPLVVDSRLNRVAQDFSKRMAYEDFFAHKAPAGDRVDTRSRNGGYNFELVLENLHAGSDSARGAVDAWIASKDGHREAMLNEKIIDIGVGYYFFPFDEGTARYVNYWTLVMGKPLRYPFVKYLCYRGSACPNRDESGRDRLWASRFFYPGQYG